MKIPRNFIFIYIIYLVQRQKFKKCDYILVTSDSHHRELHKKINFKRKGLQIFQFSENREKFIFNTMDNQNRKIQNFLFFLEWNLNIWFSKTGFCY